MAKHEVIIHENTGATKESAPCLGSYVSKETVKAASFALAASAKAGMSPIQFRAIIDGSFQAIEELERQGLVRVHTDLGVVCGVLTGSLPTADAAPDPEKNRLELTLRLADDIRLSLADTVPSIAVDESLTKLRVDNVMDLETPKPYNLIHGQGVFRVAGFNMELSDEGATVYLSDKNGVTYAVTVDEVISKQLFRGHTAELLEPGDYKLVVKSRAGDAEGPLQTAFRKVKYLKVTPPPAPKPTLTNAHSPGCAPMEVTMHEDVILDGTRLGGFERLVARHEEYAGEIELPTEGVTANDDGTQLSLPGSVWDAITAKVDPSVMPTRPITFEVITPEGTASISPTVP